MNNGKKQPRDIKSAYRISYLLAAYIRQDMTPEEKEELEAWKNENEHNSQLFSELTDEKNVQKLIAEFQQPDTETYLEKSKAHLKFLRRTQRNRIFSYVAAVAVIVVVVILVSRYFISNSFTAEQTTAEVNIQDILPGDTVATITLGNGKRLDISTIEDTILNGSAIVSGSQGQLIYNISSSEKIEQHTLTVPKKGFYKLSLSDGTKVWLNSYSSITYPTRFDEQERRVKVSGETYFEVAPDKYKPFLVETDQFVVKALGTSFNINTYADEPVATTTLVEGSVALIQGDRSTLLKPGQQWQLKGTEINIINTDTRIYTSWTTHEFRFSNTPLEAIMRQIARWYDAEVVYKDMVSVELNGSIEKDVPLSKLLYLLGKTDEVHFSIEGNKIIVTK